MDRSLAATENRYHPAVRSVYAARIGSDAAADRFLSARLEDMPEPSVLVGLGEAADRIERAIDAGERIAVFGHDDPDGVTSAAILVEVLEAAGAPCDPYIPDRDVEGHGLYPELVRRFRARGSTLLVTTDGCSANAAEEELATALGLDLVVTDHHEVAPGRAVVRNLVNPKAVPATAEAYGDLTGAGVAALLARELLRRRFGDAGEKKFCRLLDLVALGTIADWGDLARSNRGMVVQGLTAVGRGDRPAVELARRALAIGPDAVLRRDKCERLAAVFASVPSREGRSSGLDALLGRPSWAGDTGTLLQRFLATEKAQDAAVARAEAEAERLGVLDGAPAVLLLPDVEPRFLGKAATRIAERTGRPAAALREVGGKLVAELRGPDGVHLVEILGALRDRLESWGGHRTAAGFSTDASRAATLPGELADAFAACPACAPAPRAAELDLRRSQIDPLFSRSCRAAMPFGRGNPSPVFRIVDYRRGGTPLDPDGRAHEAVELIERGFPEGVGDRHPLVTFLPKGRGGLVMQFEGLDPAEGAA